MRRVGCWIGWLMLVGFSGCWSRSGPEVVLYSAQDAEFAEPVLADIAVRTDLAIRPKFDTESTKTVGLMETIVAESSRPRCDVFWNNEILNTLRLENRGLLDAYRPPSVDEYPSAFQSPHGKWHGFAARARVLIVNRELMPEAERPKSIEDLADAKWRGKTGMAKPLFGTTGTHAACLFAAWGDDKAKDYFRRLRANQIQVLAGNKRVAEAVSAGQLAFGITDTDDAIIEVEKGRPVAIVYPDQGPAGLGTLFIPNTVAIVRRGPHPAAARRLVAELLSARVETMLAKGPSAQSPLSNKVTEKLRVETPSTVKSMSVDFQAAADRWDTAAAFLRDEFTR